MCIAMTVKNLRGYGRCIYPGGMHRIKMTAIKKADVVNVGLYCIGCVLCCAGMLNACKKISTGKQKAPTRENQGLAGIGTRE